MNSKPTGISTPTYNSILKDISLIYENAQSEGDGNWNKTTLFAHWKIGERIIEVEQGQKERAAYGDMVLKQLSKDSSAAGERPSDGWKIENSGKVSPIGIFGI